jgi:hypothetical protein
MSPLFQGSTFNNHAEQMTRVAKVRRAKLQNLITLQKCMLPFLQAAMFNIAGPGRN